VHFLKLNNTFICQHRSDRKWRLQAEHFGYESVSPNKTAFRTWGHALGHLEGVNMYEHTIETTNTIKCHESIHLIHLKSGIFQAFWSQCIIWPYSALLVENKGKVINLVALNLHFCEISQCFLSWVNMLGHCYFLPNYFYGIYCLNPHHVRSKLQSPRNAWTLTLKLNLKDSGHVNFCGSMFTANFTDRTIESSYNTYRVPHSQNFAMYFPVGTNLLWPLKVAPPT
jgi:hypothetical protein